WGELDDQSVMRLCDGVAAARARGHEIVLVCSGAIAAGLPALGMATRPSDIGTLQAIAAVGQPLLMERFGAILGARGLLAGQVLLTPHDFGVRSQYLHARETLRRLLDLGVVPVVNENDTVADDEIRYGDNDRLAARVATMIGADLLVLFSDVDGLYTAPPAGDPTARHIAEVERITPAIEAMAGGAGSDLSRGGMRTKIEAGKIATVSGIHMVIADGRRERPLQAIADGARCTWFLTPSNPVTARKGWIAGALEPRGTLVVDAGAARALAGGASLLPVGVRRIEGAFARGDAVVVSDGARELGRGLVAYDADEAERIIGRASREIEDILGYPGRAEMIHRDDLALTQPLAAKAG
ncbi:MAG: glutamate 5-kinase, partial [Microvirga sp.]